MFYLVLTILLNVVISVIFKLFPKYQINTLQAIVVNYVVCVITGSLFLGQVPYTTEIIHRSWVPFSLLMGVGFISVFNLIAYCTKIDGITTTTIANKLSLVIPVLFSFFLYHEHAGAAKIIGILIAFPAVYFTSRVHNDDNKPQNLFWPSLLFIGGGLLDTLMNYVQSHHLNTNQDQALYTIFCFSMAGAIGIALLTILVALKKVVLLPRNIIAGICIGIPNYFSIYFFIKALHSNFLQSSATIPVLNIGILVMSAITAIVLFREKANSMRILGLLMSILAIYLIAAGDK